MTSLPLPDLGALALAALAAFLLAGLLAPFETLGWWAGWFGTADEVNDSSDAEVQSDESRPARSYLVFLSGIHTVAGRSFAVRERAFLERLHSELPETRVVEVFPYSVTNRALTGQRVFARFWRWALARKLGRRQLAGLAGMLINLRNGWQVAVSADRRYGPMYDAGSAELFHSALRQAGYPVAGGVPIVLVGYSGGGQIALGAAAPLSERTGARIDIVSIGGVMASPRTLHGLGRVVHLRGRNDRVARIGAAFFPGRWPLVRWSAWNRAMADGRIEVVDLGEMDHTGRDGYLDDETRTADGPSFMALTASAVARLAREAERR